MLGFRLIRLIEGSNQDLLNILLTSISVLISAVSSAITAIVAVVAIRQTSRQLRIEQTPLVYICSSFTTDEAIDKLEINQDKKDELKSYCDLNMEIPRQKNGIFNFYTLKIRNIGRGAALNITVSPDPKSNETISLFRSDQPHSHDLGAGAGVFWTFDKKHLKRFRLYTEKRKDNNEGDTYIDIYLNFEDLNGKKYLMKTQMRVRDGLYKVMKNKLIK